MKNATSSPLAAVANSASSAGRTSAMDIAIHCRVYVQRDAPGFHGTDNGKPISKPERRHWLRFHN
jgi:hypothetical protein